MKKGTKYCGGLKEAEFTSKWGYPGKLQKKVAFQYGAQMMSTCATSRDWTWQGEDIPSGKDNISK